MDHNEYTRRYALKIVTMAPGRDSHGMFDFEKRQLPRETSFISKESNFIKLYERFEAIKPDIDIRTEYKTRA